MSSFSSSSRNQESKSRSNPNPKRIYDVFLSFYGKDTRASFTSHLYTALRKSGLEVYADYSILKGDQISASVLQAIEGSRISVIVVSRNYADSRWCLQELEKIMDCRRNMGQVVLPLFFGVDPLEVRNQRGMFGKTFENLIRRISMEKDKELSLRAALREAGSIAGFVLMDSRNESEDIKNVVEHVTRLLDRTDLFIADHPVGLESRVQDVIKLLNYQKSKDVLLLGIWGMGGIGKSTIAKVIYNKIGRNFEGMSFLQNIRDVWEQVTSRVSLQEQLVSDIYKTEIIRIHSIESGKMILKERLCHKRVLVVLDDVNKLLQLNALSGGREWFGPGSLIIITTRYKRLLSVVGVDHVYRMKEMDYSESIELFSLHAFKQASPREDFAGLSRNVVDYSGGLPLALVVLGSELFGRGVTEWESVLDRLKRTPHPLVQKQLKISFDGLNDDTVKDIFLDVSCFFIGMDRNDVIQTLNGFGRFGEIGISILEEQSLVTVDEMNKLGMHVLLLDMGREIIRERSRMEPGPRSYDAFLSFRGEDTRSSFTSLLYTSLQNAGIYVFMVDDDLRRGHQITTSLLHAIGGSIISVIVFSRNYANSRWCLQELENIMECHRTTGQLIVPVFYDVDPSEVRHQIGMFGEAFEDLLKGISVEKDKELSWRTALHEAGGISGLVVIDSKNKIEDIMNVVEHINRLLDSLFVADHPVGVQSRVRDVIKLLNYQKSKDVQLLGMWGMGGIGKTAIAKAVYNQIGRNFERRSFITNIKEVWEQDTRHVSLQERLLSDIYKTTTIRIHSIESGKLILKERLCHKRVLVVLDDVNKLEQLNALSGSREWFGPGSLIIITTRDKRLLSVLGVDHVYRMKEMDYNESVELFSLHAFKQKSPREDFAGLSRNVVDYSGGLPLALVVLGSELFGRGITEWVSVLDRLRRTPHPVVQKQLKISFDGLNDYTEKDIFLDIVCFFIGMDRNDVIQTLNGFGRFAKIGISVLEERSLVTVDDMNKLGMHVLLQDMGGEIIRERSRTEPGPRSFDVFLSFRGEDTRASFTSHLYNSLENAGIYVFRDDDALQRGDRISISLLQAIGRSIISVIILSRNYANSRWCLQELEKIMECRRTMGQVVVPVFYAVEPSEVRNQTGMFGEAFEDVLETISVQEDKVLSWRTALHDVGGISGFVVIDSRNESEDIKNIVEDVTRLLERTELFIADHPVGVESRVQDMIQLLNNQQSRDVILLGIWGMGGIGKTTIAKAIYNQIGRNFEGRSFLLNIREVWGQDNGQVCLQNRLLSDIYKTTKIKIHSIESGKIILKERLRQKRVFLVLDDVNKLEQLKALSGSREWFGPGSSIIITTRDVHLLRVLKVDPICRMKEMDESESVELFSWHAFNQASPREEFAEHSRNVVAYSGGLPLALEVLGSYLSVKGITEWNGVLEKLIRIPNDQVQKKLRISFDGLSDDTEKEIFLDIACFFIGMDRSDVIQILNGCGLFTESGISVLVERCLVTVDNKNKLGMHDLLRDMGREIVREKLPKEPGKRSRLWHREEVIDVLSKHTGTEAVEGLALKFPRINTSSTKAFEKMKKLRLLQLAGVQLVGNFEYLSRDLRWLCWHGFPLRHTPKNCYQGSLVAIELKYSNLNILWKEAQLLEKLKILNLSHSLNLRETPDFSNLPNLEKLILKDCPSLSSVSHTIGHLNELLLINLKDCTSLRKLPRSIYKLKSLKCLILSGCSMIDKLEEDLEQMESLTTLIADKSAITRVPFSVVKSKSIGYISLCGYEGFSRDVFPSLIWSWMSPTNSISSLVQTYTGMSSLVSLDVSNSSFPVLSSILKDLQKLQRLWVECDSEHQLNRNVERILDTLIATNCKELEAMPTTSQVSNIKTSALIDCRSQVHISGSKNSLNSLLIQMGMNCQVTSILRESILQKLPTNGPGLLPGDNYPDWLTFNGKGSSVIFEVPQVNGRNLKTMMSIVYYSSPDNITSKGLQNVLIINRTKNTIHVYRRDALTSFEDEEWQSVISNIEPGNKVEVVVAFGNGFTVEKTAVYLIYDELIDEKMKHCHAPDNNVVVSGRDEIRFRRPFTLRSLLISPPFWFGLAAVLIWSRRRFDGQRR